MKKLLPMLALTAIASTAYSWGDSGHGAIAMIAYRHLTPEARAKVDALMTTGVEKRYHNLLMTSFWADEWRSDHGETGPWHYINIHFRTDGKPVTMKALDENVSWAVTKFRAKLADKSLNSTGKAEAFRFLVHFVGDAHQPMHNVARDTNAFPEGDRGGNDFPIVPGNGLPSWNTNLHRVWDSGCGAFDIGIRGWEDGALAKTEALSHTIEKAYPLSLLSEEAKVLDPDAWVQNGYKIAKDFAYNAPEGGTPDKYYVKTGQEICLKRAALAGYRLAAILNDALSS